MPKKKELPPLPKFKLKEVAGVVKINNLVESHRFFNEIAKNLHFPTSNPFLGEDYLIQDFRLRTYNASHYEEDTNPNINFFKD